MSNNQAQVGIVKGLTPRYCTQAPYHPDQAYPEYPFTGQLATEPNPAYAGVRRLLYTLGYDREHFDTPAWNPLGWLIQPGMQVVLKPNFVLSRHSAGKDLFAIITHPSVLRAVADYVWIALQGRGRIVIADAPQYDCNFEQLRRAAQLDEMREFYGPRLDVLDLRSYWSRWKHFASLLEPLPGDPQGSLTVNLGTHSALYNKPQPAKLYGAVYNRDETIRHHSGDRQEYLLSRTIMDADVVISVPKLKVHKKVGVTLNVKGLVGIATNKNYLVHYSLTPPRDGGDQYPNRLFTPVEEALIKTERWMYDHLLAPRKKPLEFVHRSIYATHNRFTRRLGLKVSEDKRLLDAGNWYGNDSAWRMAVDLLKAFYFADTQGQLQQTRQRRTFSIIDGIIGGERNGPLSPDPKPAGVLIGGADFLATDLVATRLMGFDSFRLKMYQSLLHDPEFDFGVHDQDDIQVLCDDPVWSNCLHDHAEPFLSFLPHPGWVGHIEIHSQEQELTSHES